LSSTKLLVHDVCPYRVLKKIGAAAISWLGLHKALEEPGAKKQEQHQLVG
jgi:threonine/homoserine/homoserine lactone efflux protein